MRVVYITASSGMGGAEAVTLSLIRELRRASEHFEPCLLVLDEEGPLLQRARLLGASCRALQPPSAVSRFGDAGAGAIAGTQRRRLAFLGSICRATAALPNYLRRFRTTVCEMRPSIVHACGIKPEVFAAAALPARIPAVWHIHDYVSLRPLASRCLRYGARACNGAICVSHSVREDFARIAPSVSSITVYNSVDLDEFSPSGRIADLDSLAGLDRSEGLTRIGLISTGARWKGQDIFLRAISMLPRSLPLRAYVIGGALYRTEGSQYSLDELKHLASDLGIFDRVAFTGFIPSPAEAMRALDVVVHASVKPEPFGLVIPEAMACGRSVIISYAGGAAELIHPGQDALAASPGDPASLAAGLRQLINDPELRQRLGFEARRSAERKFDARQIPAQVMPIYERLLGRTGGAVPAGKAASQF